MEQFQIGKKLPGWSLEPINGKSVPRTESFRGKPLVILFFYLGCPGCKGRAIPYANRLVYENGDWLNVVGIHTHFEGPDYTDEQIEAAKEEFHIRFPVFQDAGLATTYHDYRASGTPHWVLVDTDGTVTDSIFGSDPNRALLRIHYHVQQFRDQQQEDLTSNGEQ